MRRLAVGLGAALLQLASCGRPAPPAPASVARYVVAAPWRGERGVWFYPAARFGGGFSGLAVAWAPPPGPLTDGAVFDPARPAAAAQSLQLPVVLEVTNLLNGRRMDVRADALGPADPGRAIALDAAAMRALGMTGTTPVAVAIDGAASQAIADDLGGLPRAAATAPREGVTATPLGPPGSTAPAAPAASAALSDRSGAAADDDASRAGTAVPDTVTAVPVSSVLLMLDAGRFSDAAIARGVAATIGGLATADGPGRHASWLVTRGPFADVATADAALDQALAAGISGARITAGPTSDSAGDAMGE